MKKILLLMALVSFTFMNAQVIFSEDFDDITTLTNWNIVNVSNPVGPATYFQGNTASFVAYNGADDSYIGSNYESTDDAGTGDISDWLISPTVGLRDGDVISFYTRIPTVTATAPEYPDRLELRISDTGASSVEPTDVTDTGSYSILAIEVNPSLVTGVYPQVWTEYTYTVTGMSSTTDTDSRIAFRYFVTDGGGLGDNSNYIGIDAFSITRPSSASINDNELVSQVSIYPTSTKDNFTINNKSNTALTSVSLFDVNGRVVLTQSLENLIGEKSINVSNLSTGMYFVQLNTANATVTKKLIKK